MSAPKRMLPQRSGSAPTFQKVITTIVHSSTSSQRSMGTPLDGAAESAVEPLDASMGGGRGHSQEISAPRCGPESPCGSLRSDPTVNHSSDRHRHRPLSRLDETMGKRRLLLTLDAWETAIFAAVLGFVLWTIWYPGA